MSYIIYFYYQDGFKHVFKQAQLKHTFLFIQLTKIAAPRSAMFSSFPAFKTHSDTLTRLGYPPDSCHINPSHFVYCVYRNQYLL